MPLPGSSTSYNANENSSVLVHKIIGDVKLLKKLQGLVIYCVHFCYFHAFMMANFTVHEHTHHHSSHKWHQYY